MNSAEIAPRRMRNQHLWGKPFDSPEEVVHHLAAMQGQELPIAKWSVAQRAKGVTEADMDEAFAEGRILRTHVLRPTWHFVSPEDIRWLLAATAHRVQVLNAHPYRRLELDGKLLARATSILRRAVEGGHRTRKELAEELTRGRITLFENRLSYFLMNAELDAVIISGAPRGKQQTYASFDERVPKTRSVGRDEALGELTRRYFTSRGPSTVKDFVRWASLTMDEGRHGLDIVGSELDSAPIDDRTYWFAPSRAPRKAPSARVDLVQIYDETIMGYSESRDALFGLLEEPPGPWDGTTLLHAILLDGHLIGNWRPVRERGSVVLETSFLRPLGRTRMKALDAAVERYSRFLSMPVTRR